MRCWPTSTASGYSRISLHGSWNGCEQIPGIAAFYGYARLRRQPRSLATSEPRDKLPRSTASPCRSTFHLCPAPPRSRRHEERIPIRPRSLSSAGRAALVVLLLAGAVTPAEAQFGKRLKNALKQNA